MLYIRNTLPHRTGAKRRVGAQRGELRPHERSRCAEHEGSLQLPSWRCARPTGGSHGRTTEAFTLLTAIGILLENPNTVRGRKVKAAPGAMGRTSAATGIIRAEIPKDTARLSI